MIDTDKYEGHTPAPWRAVYVEENGTEGFMLAQSGPDRKWLPVENCHLAADAPLLLEEVKRLREELFDTHAFYSNMEQMLAFAVGIKQGLLTDMSMDNLVDAVNRDYHDRLNEHMDGRLRKND